MDRRDFLKGALGVGAAAALGPLLKIAEPTKAAPVTPPLKVPEIEPEPFYGTPVSYAAIGSGSEFHGGFYLYADDR